MKNISYKIVILPTFYNDLKDITNYIAEKLKNPEAAIKLTNYIQYAIKKRAFMPTAFKPYKSKINHKNIYYRINILNFSIFYVVINDTMEIRRLIYSKSNIKNLI